MERSFDVIIIGAGILGSSLIYTLSRYTSINSLAILEKEKKIGEGNSNKRNNSKTLHEGFAETNYTFEKMKKMKFASSLIKRYVLKKYEQIPEFIDSEKDRICYKIPFFVLAINDEIGILERKYEEIKKLFPEVQLLGRKDIEKLEPNLVNGRKEDEKLFALYKRDGIVIDFGKLANELLKDSFSKEKRVKIYLNEEVRAIREAEGKIKVISQDSEFTCDYLIVSASANSFYLASKMRYLSNDYALFHVRGNYYSYPLVLKSKVYRPQVQKIPFLAIHADPNPFLEEPKLEFGPTAEISLSKELNKNFELDFIVKDLLSNLKLMNTLPSILGDKEIRSFLFRNLLYRIPLIGKRIFAEEAKKIIPKLNPNNLESKMGGIRPQLVDLKKKELILGEKIFNFKNMTFCITPSPGASASLLDALEITKQVCKELDENFYFEKYMRDFDIDSEKLLNFKI